MTNIVLIGMPGCGKSTLGVILAKALAYDFIDTDLLIGRRAGMTLQEYIDKNGTDAFGVLEDDVNSSVECENTVIATGGSVVYCDRAMRHLHERGLVVYIDIPYEEMCKRILNFRTRGIVLKPGCTLLDLYCERGPLYMQNADIIYKWEDGKSAEAAVEDILALLEKAPARDGD